jgi:hypothetical protein
VPAEQIAEHCNQQPEPQHKNKYRKDVGQKVGEGETARKQHLNPPFRAASECPAPGANSTCGFYARRPQIRQRFPQGLFLGFVERAAHDSAANAAQRSEHLVRRHFADQQKQSGVTRLQRSRRPPHELVVDSEIGQLSAERA